MASKKIKVQFKQPVLTAISYLLPLIVASGLLIAIGNLCGGSNVESLEGMTVPDALTTVGVFGMGLIPAFISGYIAYTLADRPGLAPGFLMGMIASFLGTGFLGGLIGGFIAGYIALALVTYLKVPKWAQALMPMMIVPTITAILGALIMLFVIGEPVMALTQALNDFIVGLDQSAKLAYGFIIGFIGCIDYGGAISKVPNLICDGLLADGIMEPEGIKVLAAMVPPFGVTLAWLFSKWFHKPIFNNEEVENIKVAFPMGLCMISEGVIPIAMNDLVRTVCATSIGCGVCGAISFFFGNASPVPSGGVFVIPAMSEPLVAVLALLAGTLVTGTILFLLTRRIDPDAVDIDGNFEEEELDLSEFKLS